MIEKRIMDELKKIGYKLKKEGKNGFELHAETKAGSGDICFVQYPIHQGKFYCAYRITDNHGKVIEEKGGEFDMKSTAERYLTRICCGIMYSKLKMDS